ncbi:MAG: AbrB/MazE/SpoVT family DNA-binding domain-containing protein [Gemmatimonadaceae bacterium]|nr:AbrB/MazE/SpoVT family DNA-binding domain-containing protein [Gemmatimonadaceae bacterium]
MKRQPLKVAPIGNSRGVRIPAQTLKRYQIGDLVIMEEREEGILLRPVQGKHEKLSWAETADAMAQSAEDWSEWDDALGDGTDQLTWPVPAKRKSS